MEELKLFEKTSQNQAFLLKLFKIMYHRGAYNFVYHVVFPVLLDSYGNTIKMQKAHIYASLSIPMYQKAFEILHSIEGRDAQETIDLKTSAISNIRRGHLSKDISLKSLEGLLLMMIKCYDKIYEPIDKGDKKVYCFYAGINLAYNIALFEVIFPQNTRSKNYDIKQIYQNMKNIEEDYYSQITQIEFKLLLNHANVPQELAYLLENIQPSEHLIHQTQRQMGTFFLDIIQKFSKERPLYFQEFKKCLVIFKDYLALKIQ